MFLPQAMALAKLQEDKLHDRRKGSYSYSQPAFITTPSTYVSTPPLQYFLSSDTSGHPGP